MTRSSSDRSAQAADALRHIVREVIDGLDPATLVRDQLEHSSTRSSLGPGPIRVLAVGKAALPMAEAAERTLGPLIALGLAIAPTATAARGTALVRPRWTVLESDHPLPTQRSVAAAEHALRLVAGLDGHDSLARGPVLALISGGASALMSMPAPGLTLNELREATLHLMHAGCDIHQLNAVRRMLDMVKGGGLARATRARCVVALLLSDVLGDDPSTIGSGPFAAPDLRADAALAAIDRAAAVLGRAMPRVRGLLTAGPQAATDARAEAPPVTHTIIGSNALAMTLARTAIARRGVTVQTERSRVTGEASAWGEEIGKWLASQRAQPAAAIWGGETVVRVGRAIGKGGRCQEAALSAALRWAGSTDGALLVLATDGIDGPTDAAGALIDSPAARALAADPNARAALEHHDAYPALDRLGLLLRTGPTGTNANDIAIALRC